jgi:hypothetical protein
LGANLQRDRVLILEFVERCRLRRGRRKGRAARHILIEVEPLDFARERQVFDRRPAGEHAELGDVEVRVTSVGAGSVANVFLR